MEAQSLGSHQHSWWFSCFSLREKLARSHNKSFKSMDCLDIPFLSCERFIITRHFLFIFPPFC